MGAVINTLDFALARSKHLEWKIKLRSFLDGKTGLTRAQATSHKDCELGKWLYSQGLERYGSSSTMQQLEQTHVELHAIVQRVVQMKNGGDAAGAQKEFSKLGPVSDKVIALLKEMEQN